MTSLNVTIYTGLWLPIQIERGEQVRDMKFNASDVWDGVFSKSQYGKLGACFHSSLGKCRKKHQSSQRRHPLVQVFVISILFPVATPV